MSLYSKQISKEIKFIQESILKNNDTINILKNELFTGENVYSRQDHKKRIYYLLSHNFTLNMKLEKVKRLIF